MAEYAVVEAERQGKHVTFIKSYPQHFTAVELNIPEAGFFEFYKAQVAVDEFTVHKDTPGKVNVGKVTVDVNTLLVFILFPGSISEIWVVKFSGLFIQLLRYFDREQ